MSNNTSKSREKRKRLQLEQSIMRQNEKLGWSKRTYTRKGKCKYEEKSRP